MKKSLSDFQAISPSQKKAKKLCTSLSFLDELSKGIMFIGNCGVDDIGAEKISEWTLATLEDILDERCGASFAASNWTEEQWLNQCKSEAEKLQSQRIWSRLYQLCEVMQISGRDYRRLHS